MSAPDQPAHVDQETGTGASSGTEMQVVTPGNTTSDLRFVNFPNGAKVPIHIRGFPWVETELKEDIGASYDALRQRAAGGDGVAALILSENLRYCHEFAYESDEDLTQALDDLQSTHSYRDPRGHLVTVSPHEQTVDVDGYIETLSDATERCRGLPLQRRGEWQEWLAKSSEAGLHVGALKYAQSSSKDQLGLAAYEHLWSLGGHVGIGFAGEAYRDGWGDVEPDPVKAYAYMLLYFSLTEAIYGNPDGSYSAYVESVRRTSRLDELSALLTHAQVAEALDLANRTLTENKQCCVGQVSSATPVTSATW